MTIVNLRRAESKIAPTRTKDGWKEILLGTFRSISEDRVLAAAAGVTFYGLLALFPAIGAIVSLYGLFADGASIRDNLDRISNILPGGAIEIISDQIQRVAAAGSGTLSFSFLLKSWYHNMGCQCRRQSHVRCHQYCLPRQGREELL